MAIISVPDSASYLQFDWSFPGFLHGNRTIGYPAFLKIVQAMDPRLVSLSILQLWIHLLAVFFFALGLGSLRVSRMMVLCIATPLLYSPAIRTSYSYLLSDSLACSLSVLTLSMAMVVVRYPSKRSLWGVLAFLLAATYLVRPAYLFLIAFIPAAILFLGVIRLGRRRFKLLSKFFLIHAVLACAGPFILICSLRLAVVGEFGLVSFGGYNIIGLAAQFLNPEDIPRLPVELRPLSEEIVLEQRKRRLIQVNETGSRVMSPHEIMSNYNIYIHQISVPYLVQLGMQPPEINLVLGRLSRVLLRLHRHDYGQCDWIYSLAYCFGNFPDFPIFIFCLLLLICWASFLVRAVFQNAPTRHISILCRQMIWQSLPRLGSVFLWLKLSW